MKYSLYSWRQQWAIFLLIAILSIISITAFAESPSRLIKGDRFVLISESLDAGTDEWVKVTNEFSVLSSEGNAIKFVVMTYGGNLHTCELEGVAVWKGSYYEFTEKLDDQLCIFRIHSSKNQVRLEDKDLQCRAYCGARAGLNGFVLKREKLKKK